MVTALCEVWGRMMHISELKEIQGKNQGRTSIGVRVRYTQTPTSSLFTFLIRGGYYYLLAAVGAGAGEGGGQEGLGEAEAGEQAGGGAHGLEDKEERTTVVGKGKDI